VTRFGDQPIPNQLGPEEGWRLIVPVAPMAANSMLLTAVGASYTMPFAGRLVADFKARATWTVDQNYWRVHLGPSIPAPAARTDHAQWTGLPGGFTLSSEIPVTAQWDLAKGTVVTFQINVVCGTLGGLTLVAAGGFFRATPT